MSMNTHEQQDERTLYSISQLNRLTKQLLEDAFPPLWVVGEISNLSTPSSGHIYFTLKDETAQVRCAMFRHRNRAINFKLENGMQVHAFAQVSLYEGRGDYQLIVDMIEEAGDGILQKRFEALKKQLQAEGLFEQAHKKAAPSLPKCIGIISSTTGAALRDVLSVHRRRFPSIPVIIYPTPVQGDEATPKIIAAIQRANELKQCDVLLLVRGGGSLEDLWCFNEEKVARAVFASQIPIVAGIGHEIDFSITDFVADVRAPTPSAAAELVTPDRQEILQQIQHRFERMQKSMLHSLQQWQHAVTNLRKRLRHPGDYCRELSQRIDHLETRLEKAWHLNWHHQMQSLNHLIQRLAQHNPKTQIQQQQMMVSNQQQRLQTAIKSQLKNYQQQLATMSRALDAVSPLNTLSRGFSITMKDDQIIRQANQVTPGDQLTLKLQQGKILAIADKITADEIES